MTKKSLLLAGLVVLLLSCIEGFCPWQAHAGLSVGGALVDAELFRGLHNHRITVALGENDPPAAVRIEVGGLGQQLDGAVQVLSKEADVSPYSARSFITLDESLLYLKSGQTREVNASIAIPENVGAGGRYAAIKVYTVPAGGDSVQIAAGINIPVKLTIQGTKLVHSGSITGLSVHDVMEGKPVEISTIFKNTGNHHFKIKGEVNISRAPGGKMASAAIPLTVSSVIPTMSRELKVNFNTPGQFPPGDYTVKSTVMLYDGTILAEAERSFTVYPKVAFKDLGGHWAQDDIRAMAEAGIVRGMGDGTFCPEEKLTRAQFTGFVLRSLNISESRPVPGNYADVPAGTWYYEAVETACANGLIFGYGDGLFRPEASITREELAAMVIRSLEKGGRQLQVADTDAVLGQFVDGAEIQGWAREAAAVAVQVGLIKGRDGGRFAPKENATRAEAIVILKRMLVSLGKIPA
ncbi:MAG: S-layer homology domain-containing protein [Bacillota bacterium]